MRTLSLMMVLLALGACSTPSKGPKPEDRGPASSPACVVEKHSKNEWYRLTVHGKPVFDSWYTKDQVDVHWKMWEKKGKCK